MGDHPLQLPRGDPTRGEFRQVVQSEPARVTAANPLGRLIRPEEVAASVLYLCLPGAAAVNGQALAVDGGET